MTGPCSRETTVLLVVGASMGVAFLALLSLPIQLYAAIPSSALKVWVNPLEGAVASGESPTFRIGFKVRSSQPLFIASPWYDSVHISMFNDKGELLAEETRSVGGFRERRPCPYGYRAEQYMIVRSSPSAAKGNLRITYRFTFTATVATDPAEEMEISLRAESKVRLNAGEGPQLYRRLQRAIRRAEKHPAFDNLFVLCSFEDSKATTTIVTLLAGSASGLSYHDKYVLLRELIDAGGEQKLAEVKKYLLGSGDPWLAIDVAGYLWNKRTEAGKELALHFLSSSSPVLAARAESYVRRNVDQFSVEEVEEAISEDTSSTRALDESKIRALMLFLEKAKRE